MTLSELLAKLDYKFRPIIINNSPKAGSIIYSRSRKYFIRLLSAASIDKRIEIPEQFSKTLWGIKFSNSLFNAAGMFKYGEGYDTAFKQGAGAYLCGTSTLKYRAGNKKNNLSHPFISYPLSEAASNWMGLPNYGHKILAKAVQRINKNKNCPIGVSISADPDAKLEEAIDGVIQGLKIFQDTQADFIELNESCPNVPHQCSVDTETGLDSNLIARLEMISKEFILHKKRNFPIIVKFSNDTNIELVPKLIDMLVEMKFDGVNFGNTSTDYDYIKNIINPKDKKAFEYFTKTFGGGVSGSVLKNKSLNLCKTAADELKKKNTHSEFHIIRTGGVQNYKDIEQSEAVGVSLNQWYTGYFEAFAKFGNRLYSKTFIND